MMTLMITNMMMMMMMTMMVMMMMMTLRVVVEVEAGGSVTQERGRVTIRRLWSAAAAMPPL